MRGLNTRDSGLSACYIWQDWNTNKICFDAMNSNTPVIIGMSIENYALQNCFSVHPFIFI